MYTALSILKTIILRIIEVMFWLIWRTSEMREFGAISGLSIGYAAKYRLDRRYIFSKIRKERFNEIVRLGEFSFS